MCTVNTQFKKLVDQYPDAHPLLATQRQSTGHKLYFMTDTQKQFNSFRLDVGETKNMTTFWTPLGLMKFTGMIMGEKNSISITQIIYSRFMR